MKAEKFLKQLGLSVNIVIVILLLIIVYLLYCINDILSLERFSIGGQEGTTNYEILYYDSLNECRNNCPNVLSEISSIFESNSSIYNILSRQSKNPFISSCESSCNRENTINRNTMLNEICTNNSFRFNGINDFDICDGRR